MTIDEAREHVGARVEYRDYMDQAVEHGVIGRTGERYAFVLYDGDAAMKATDPGRLTLLPQDGTP